MDIKIHFKLCSIHFRDNGSDNNNDDDNDDAPVDFKPYCNSQVYPLNQDLATLPFIPYGIFLKVCETERCPQEFMHCVGNLVRQAVPDD